MQQKQRPKKGIFIFNRLPASVRAGDTLQVWIDLRLATELTAEEDVLLEIIGVGKVSWIVTPDSQFATDQDRRSAKSRQVQDEQEFWSKSWLLTKAQVISNIWVLQFHQYDSSNLITLHPPNFII